MKINVKRIPGCDCPSKVLLMIDGEPITFANSQNKISQLISYVEGFSTGENINNKKILRKLNKWRNK